MSPYRRQLCVISVPFGGGHQAVAEAIADELAEADVDVKLVDALAAISRLVPLAPLGAALYFALMLVPLRPLYRRLFIVVDRWPVLVGRLCSVVFGRRARAWLRTHDPDTVVSTFPLVTFVLGEARASINGRARLISVVTDGGAVNRSWFAGRADMFVVTDDEAWATGRRELLDPGKLIQVSLPLRAGFARMARNAKCHGPNVPRPRRTVLVWGGGQGMARGMLGVAREVRRSPRAIRPVFVTGDNQRLARRLTALTEGTGSVVMSRCEDVPGLLRTVDAVIGKAGWVSLAEAAAAGLHTICIDALPGQEQENLRVHVRRGSASWEPDPAKAVRMAEDVRRTATTRISQADKNRLLQVILA